MAIVFKSSKYKKIIIDSKMIIGVLGNNYEDFLYSLEGKGVYFLNRDKPKNIDINKNDQYAKMLNIKFSLENDNHELSHSNQKLLKYYYMVKSNAKIMIIDEPYLDLDFDEKKRINNLFNILIKEGRTIIIASHDVNVIYLRCKKVILVNRDNLYYGNINILTNCDILKKYYLNMPDIVRFIELAKEKNIKIPYSQDIRDLIKDVYRNVS